MYYELRDNINYVVTAKGLLFCLQIEDLEVDIVQNVAEQPGPLQDDDGKICWVQNTQQQSIEHRVRCNIQKHTKVRKPLMY